MLYNKFLFYKFNSNESKNDLKWNTRSYYVWWYWEWNQGYVSKY